MGLVDLKTDLKSLKFGHDRLDGGDSGQPYIKAPLLDKPGQLSQLGSDFLLRGGLKAPIDAATDIVRLTKWFFDFKNPKGLLFTAKQNLLSRTAVATQASGNDSNRDSWTTASLNGGIYTPLSTLAQAGINFLGGHADKQGLIPFIKGVTTYLDRINNIIGENDGSSNRLFELYTDKIKETPGKDNNTDPTLIQSYNGGPGSILGIGKTNIPFALDRRGAPLRTGINNSYASPKTYNIGTEGIKEGVSWQSTNQKSHELGDFKLPYLKDQETSIIMSNSPSYKGGTDTSKAIDGKGSSRINYISPGQRGNIISYTKGKRDNVGVSQGPVDRINALPIYTSDGGAGKSKGKASNDDKDLQIDDLVPFYISVLDNVTPSIKKYIHFRAYISGFSDSYTAAWNAQQYMGRAESFWKYGGFGRTISLGFTVAAQSREELIPMYKKLNFLASTLAPRYSKAGLMAGTLITLTIGGYLYEQPGFLTGLSFDVPDDSPWEIGIDDEGENISSKDGIKQLPLIINVSGFSFTPIQEFRPETQQITTSNESTLQTDKNIYGQQRYIQLKNKNGSNYDFI